MTTMTKPRSRHLALKQDPNHADNPIDVLAGILTVGAAVGIFELLPMASIPSPDQKVAVAGIVACCGAVVGLIGFLVHRSCITCPGGPE